MRQQDGQALLMVVVVMLILQMFAGVFLARVGFEQRLAGGSTRNLAALYLAEAGLQKALWILEQEKLDGSASGDWSLPHQEVLGPGTFTIEAMDPVSEGLVSIVARGDAGGVHRRVKALARMGPQALAYGLYGQDSVRFGGQSRTYLVPFSVSGSGRRRAGDLAAGGEIRFDSRGVALNSFRGVRLPLRDGTIDDYRLLGSSVLPDPPAGLIELVLAGRAQLISGIEHRPVRLEELQQQIEGLAIQGVRVRAALPAPSIDVNYYTGLAEANTANAAINTAAGTAGGDPGLKGKMHSRYSTEEFEAIVDYLNQKDQLNPHLQGMIVVDGDVDLYEGQRLTIIDGALMAIEGTIGISDGARLEVRHGPRARTLPGLIAWGEGMIQIEERAVAIVDGLILVDWELEIHGGLLDVIGAVAARNFLNEDGTVVVRYDPRALATVGLQRTGKGLAELVSWHELR